MPVIKYVRINEGQRVRGIFIHEYGENNIRIDSDVNFAW